MRAAWGNCDHENSTMQSAPIHVLPAGTDHIPVLIELMRQYWEYEQIRGFAADQVARSMSVLIRGRFRLTFRRGNVTEEILLEKEGDYAVWLPGVEHTWIAEAEETVILTVRWPSLPYQQIERK